MTRMLRFVQWVLFEAGVAQHRSSWPAPEASITHYGTEDDPK